jgi:tetratricopeptide (TPR) repeat protein
LQNSENYKIPAELFNNVAVMTQNQMENSNPESIEKIQMLYGEALKIADLDNSNTAEATKLTVKFNIATFYELIGQNEKAEALYLELIETYPSYLDCNLFGSLILALIRLASMRLKSKKTSDAIAMLKEITEFDKGKLEAWHILGSCYFDNKDWTRVKRVLDHILTKIDKHDPYALTMYGNLYLKLHYYLTPPKDGCKKEEKDAYLKQKQDHLNKAFEFFDRAIRAKPYNLYAAAGIGSVMAELKEMQMALDIFTQVGFIFIEIRFRKSPLFPI